MHSKYADYRIKSKSGGDPSVPNNFSTQSRLLINLIGKPESVCKTDEQLNTLKETKLQFAKQKKNAALLGTIVAAETVFYYPNHFRQIILVNSNHVSFADTSEALLDLMNVMFRLESNVRMQAFSINNFFSSYRTFLKMTLPYETAFLFGRTKLFEKA